MELTDLLRWLHVVGAAVLLGTGAGIAFFMLQAHRSRDAAIIAHTAHTVVIADYLFTSTAVLVQPITGVLLALRIGWPLTQGWLLLSIGLYVLAGACWLPVLSIQKRMRDLARRAASERSPLPEAYFGYFRTWALLGIPAFASVLGIVWLMVARPVFG